MPMVGLAQALISYEPRVRIALRASSSAWV
jgi:hypothetical protein